MTTKTKYLVIALLLLVLVTTSVGLSTWNIHYQAVIGDIAYDTSTKSSILNNYVYFGATDDADRAQANIQQNGSALYTYPIGYNTNSDGSVVFDGENYSTKTDNLFTYTYQSGKEYSPSVFVPSETAIKGDLDHPAKLFLDDSALDIGWGIENVFTEIKWEYQYRLASVPFDTSNLEEDYKGNSDNYCEVNAVYYAENQITVYLSWKNGKGEHHGDGIRVDFVVDENGNESFTIRDKDNNELTAQEAKLELNSTTDFITIGVKGFRTYQFVRKNCGWTTDIPTETGVWECRITAKAANEEAYKEIINKDANDRTNDEKILVETIDLLNSNTENDVDYATQVTYAVMPAPVSKQNTVTGYNDGTEKLQAKRSGTTRGTMPLAEENQQTQEAADEYVFTLGTGDAAISGTSFVYKGQGYNIEITADFQPTEGAAAISINYAEDQEKNAQEIESHADIEGKHVHSTYGFSSDPNYIVTDPAVHYTIIKQEVKLTGWNGLETTYNGDKQEVEPILANTHGEVTFSVSYLHQSSGGDVAKNAGIYTVTAELIDAVKGSGLSANYFLVNHASNGNSTEKTDLTATFTINKAPLTVTANNHEITYGDAFAHDGVTYGVIDGQEIKNGFKGTDNATNSLAGTLSIVSTTKGEIPGYDRSAAETRKVGNYTLIASGYEDIDNESGKPIYADDGKHNYTFTYVDGTLTVNPLVAEFSWSNLDPTFNGTAQKPVATVTNEPYDDDVSISVSGEETNANVKVNEYGNMVTSGESFVLTAEYNAKADKLTGAQAGNYTLEGASGIEENFVIKPMSISGATITLGDALTYNGEEQERDFTATITLAESTELTENTDYLVAGHKATNAFTYKLTITGQGNYYQTKTSDWKILKKELTVTANDVYVTYGDVITYKSTCTGFVKDEGLGNLAGEIKYKSDYVRYQNIDNWDSTVNKGVYPIEASGYEDKDEEGNTIYVNDGKHNYTFTYVDGTLYVDKATITDISIDAYNGTYDGAQHYFSATAKTVNSQQITVTFYKGTSAEGKPVTSVMNVADSGTYNYTVTADNHYDATGTFTVTINALEIQISWGTLEFTYNKQSQCPTATVVNLIAGDDCTINVTEGQIDAGNYTATASSIGGTSAGNYKLPNANTTQFTILPKEVGLSWSGTQFTYNKTSQAPTAQATGVYDGDTCNVNVEVAGEHVNAGNYTAEAKSLSNTNYKLPTEVTQAYVILPKVAELDWDQLEFVYNKTSQAPKATVSNLENGDSCNVTVEVVGDHVIVGSYTATATDLSNDNYTLPASPSVGYTIVKASVDKPAADSTEYVYSGEPLTYKLDTNPLYTIEGTLTQTNAGSYDITISLADTHNYKWTNSDSESLTYTFTIAKATVQIPSEDSTPYVYTGQEITYNIEPNTAYNVTNNKRTIAGSQTVTVSLKDKDNYQWNNKTTQDLTYTFTIAKVTTVISDLELVGWTYGQEANSPSATINHSTAIEYTYSKDGVTYTSTVPTNAGTYYVKASVGETTNYTAATTEPVEFTIAKANYDMSGIKFTGATITYDGNPHSIAISGTLPTNVSVSYEGNGKTTVADSGTVTAIFSTTDSNYNTPASMQATLTIKQATTSITGLAIADWTFGNTPSTPSATTNFGTIVYMYKLATADESTYSSAVPTNAGTYHIKATVAGTTNYTAAETQPVEFTIEQATTVISGLTIADWTYGEDASTPSATTNFGTIVYTYYNSDGTKLDSAPTNAGTYTVVASVEGTNNYTADSTEPVEFTIAKANYDMSGITFTGETITYDGDPHSIAISGTLPTNVSVRYEGNGKTTVDQSGTVTAIFSTTDSNYNAPASMQATLTITQATTTITGLTIAGWTYDEDASTPSATTNFGTIKYWYKLTSAADSTYTETVPTDAGTYHIKATVEGTDNYTAAETQPVEFTIAKKSIDIPAADERVFTYTGNKQTYNIASDTAYTVTGNIQTDAGEHKVTVSLNDKNNYQWSNGTTADLTYTFTIAKANYDMSGITFTGETITYDGNPHSIAISGTLPTNVSVRYEGNGKTTVADSGTVTAIFSTTDSNYNAPANMQATLTIEQREVTLTWNVPSFTYNGGVQLPTATAGNLVGTDTCTVTVSATTDCINAGENTATATATALSNANYKLPVNASKTYSIAKQEVEFTVGFVAGDEGTKENGVYTWAYNGNAHTLVVTSSITSVALTLDKTITDVYWFSGSISFITANVTFADPSQANNYTIVGEKRVYLSVTPVKVRVSQQLLTFDYENNPNGIAWSTIASNVVATTQVATGTQLVKEIKYTNTTDSALTKLEGNLTIGSTFKIVYEPTGNFEFLGVNYCYLKYQTVKYNSDYGTYGTIEEAIAGSGNITLVGNSTDEDSYVLTSFSLIQNSTLFPEITLNYTLNGNRNLTVPYDSSNAAKKENGQINGDVVVSQFVYSALQIPADVVLNLEGNADIIVGAIIYYQQPNTTATGIHGVIMNNGTINVASGSTITSYGYIKGTGMINLASGSTATDCLHTYDWPGGSAAMEIYETVFPANAWSLHNISCPTKIYAGATYKGYMYVTASIITVSESVSIIGNGSSNNCMFQPDSTSPRTDSYILKYATSAAAANADKTSLTSITGSNQIAGQKDILEFHGDYVDTQFSISKTFLGQGVALQTSTSISLPTGFMDIHVKSNGTVTLSKSDYLFMPGTKLVVDEGSTVVANSGVDANFATKADIESVDATKYSYRTYYVDKYDAYAVINGSLVIGAGCGISGLIKTDSASSFLDLSNANASIGYLLMYYNGAPKQFTGKIPYGTIDDVENENFSVGSQSIESIYVSAKNANGDGYHWTVSTQQASSYTVVLDYCDGTSTTTTYRFFGDPPTLDTVALGTPQKNYYTFGGWYTDRELTTPFTEQEVVDGGKYTYYAKLAPTVYNVTYKLYSDELGETELTTGFTNNSSEYYTITDALVLYEAIGGEDMVFGGWYIVNPATADYIRLTDDNTTWPLTVGKAGDKIIGDITLGSTVKDIVLHATLKNLKKYTVTYMAQTDESSAEWKPLTVNASDSTIIEGNKISSILLSDIFDTDTYNYNNTFKYYFDTTTWYTDEACTNKFDANTVFNDVNLSGIVGNNNTVTLYAKRLLKDEVTITYMNNDGTDASTTQNAWTIPGGTATVTLNNNPTRTGWRFLGWYTAATGGTKVGDGGMAYSTQESVTLYAQWIKLITITLNWSSPYMSLSYSDVSNGQVDSVTNNLSAGNTGSATIVVTEGTSLILTVGACYSYNYGYSTGSKTGTKTLTNITSDTTFTISVSRSGSIFNRTYTLNITQE